MFLAIEEMKDVLYSYQMSEIAEGDDTIIQNGILSSVLEVKSYLTASNQKNWNDGRLKYDVDAVFSATGDGRNQFILRMCKTVAAWNICELSNVDIIYDQVKERYDNVIKTLEKIAGIGYYVNSPGLVLGDLPTLEEDTDTALKPFRSGSRTKFNHE